MILETPEISTNQSSTSDETSDQTSQQIEIPTTSKKTYDESSQNSLKSTQSTFKFIRNQINEEKKEQEAFIGEFNKFMEKYIDSKNIFAHMSYQELEKDIKTKPIISYIDSKMSEFCQDKEKRKKFKSAALTRRRATKKREMVKLS
ncbi:unnamed protein product [Brachionus calyciflorus]|uniref:Uncharacterized protein n=1 Tax=Brachionus calyciflorus TaxID=104777 RepID=A0A814N9P3_9BILA|nr:unnamed protein product [Brachionus calyciflorus]